LIFFYIPNDGTVGCIFFLFLHPGSYITSRFTPILDVAKPLVLVVIFLKLVVFFIFFTSQMMVVLDVFFFFFYTRDLKLVGSPHF
jgi:hypothetical protein